MKPTVTEQTGKKYKGLMLIGTVGICIGVIMLIGGNSPGTAFTFLLGGIGAYAYGRMGAWWNHG